MIAIRPATLADLDTITEIYNDAIAKTTATFDTQPKTAEQQRAWFDAHDAGHPILVAEEGGRVAGWASLSRWSDRAAYDGTAEDSVYIRADCRGQGVGRRLLEAIIAAGRRVGLHAVVARIAGENAVSIHLHEALGFTRAGTLREVGRKFDRWLDVHMMELIYEENGGNRPKVPSAVEGETGTGNRGRTGNRQPAEGPEQSRGATGNRNNDEKGKTA